MNIIKHIKSCEKKKLPAVVASLTVLAGLIFNAVSSLVYAVGSHTAANGEGVSANIPYVFFVRFLQGFTFILTPQNALPVLAALYLLIRALCKAIRRVSRKRHSDEAAAEKSERKIGKALFLLSFLPFAAFIVYCTVVIFTGAKKGYFMGGHTTLYGLEAFEYTFVWGGLVLCIIPVFPAAAVYQTVYIVGRLRQKREKTE